MITGGTIPDTLVDTEFTERLPKAPPAKLFPQYPASWYLFCASRQLKDKPLSKYLLERKIVAFRTASGRVSVLDGRCSHMGADLGKGKVVGEAIQCPYHSWRYGADGHCIGIPGTDKIPPFACQSAYPVEERHGFIFFFNGRQSLFPLPFFTDTDPDDFVAGRPFEFIADCTWYMTGAHGFDIQHFLTVHDRKLIGEHEVDQPSSFTLRNRYRTEVVGQTILDRLLRRYVGDTVDVSITNWGGIFNVIDAKFDAVHSRFLLLMLPLEDGTTLCTGIIYARLGRSRLHRVLVQPTSLWLRRLFSSGFLRDECDLLRQTRYRPDRFVAGDQAMVRYFNWLTTLPQEAERAETKGGGK